MQEILIERKKWEPERSGSALWAMIEPAVNLDRYTWMKRLHILSMVTRRAGSVTLPELENGKLRTQFPGYGHASSLLSGPQDTHG
jgi:hypothetical protein